MQTLVLKEPGQLEFAAAESPGAPAAGEALARVHCIGICGTDLHAYGGRQPFFSYPRILGHELGVEVLAVGDGVTNIRPGDRCSVEPYMDCGKCIACRSGKPNCCTKVQVLGVHIDGGMRERFLLPSRKLHRSSLLTFEQLALVETLAIGAHAVERAKVEREEFVLVIGAGPIGLAATQFAVEREAQVIVLDINETRLSFCQEKLGVQHTINGLQEDVLEALHRITRGDLPTVVLDATGNSRSMMETFNYAAHGGKLVFIGLFQGDVTFSDPNFHRRELTLMASRNALPEDFTRLIRLLEAGRINTTPWITHRAAFAETIHEFPFWTSPGTNVIKAMIELG